jgi:hypothetical protein
MKRKNKMMVSGLGLAILSSLVSMAYAQAPQIQPTTVIQTNASATTVDAPTSVTNAVGDGNVYEKTVTPLLREISRKKSLLELKKLDKELAKLDEDSKPKDASNTFVPLPTPVYNQPTAMTMTAPIAELPPIKVLMTYGSVNDLYAKVAMGDQGGYPVRQGDILPDGRLVFSVHETYIEVKKAKTNKKSAGVEKIFVSGSMPVTETGKTGSGTNGSAVQGPAQYSPPISSAASGGMGVVPVGGPAAAMLLPNTNTATYTTLPR